MNAKYPDIKALTERIEAAIKDSVTPETRETLFVTHYGANDIHPKHLVYWVCVQTDKEKKRLEQNSALLTRLRELLIQYNYPEEGRAGVFIGYESKQTVDRESGGNWWYHWK